MYERGKNGHEILTIIHDYYHYGNKIKKCNK